MPSTRIPTTITTGGGPPPVNSSESIAAALTAHITDPTGAHAATAISTVVGPAWYGGGGNPASNAQVRVDNIVSDLAGVDGYAKIGTEESSAWHDTSTIPAGSIRSQLEAIIESLADDTGGAGGANLIGSGVISNTTVTVAAGSILDQITQISKATGIQYAGGPSWAGGTGTITNPATNVEAQIDKIITDLAKSGGADAGVFRIGTDGVTTGTVALPAGHLEQRLVDLQNGNIRGYARVDWRGGRTNVDTDVPAAINKIIVDLSDSSIADDGAERIGAEAHNAAGDATVDLSLGSVRSQLNTLSDHAVSISEDNILAGKNTFNNDTYLNAEVHLDDQLSFTGATRVLLLDATAAPLGETIVGQTNMSSTVGAGANGRDHKYIAQAGQSSTGAGGGDGGNVVHVPGGQGLGISGNGQFGGREIEWGGNISHFYEFFTGGGVTDTVSTSYVERIRLLSPRTYMHFVLEVQVMQWEDNANANNDTHARMRRVAGTYGFAYGTPWDFGPPSAGYAWNWSTANVADRSGTIGVDLVSTSTGLAVRTRNTAAFTGTEGTFLRLWVIGNAGT